MTLPARPALSWCSAWVLASVLSLVGTAGAVAQTQPSATAAGSTHESTDWSSLSAAQRQALAPLASQWGSLDDSSRDKWLVVAERYPRLSPAAQERMRSRMTQWAKLPPQQRGEARLRFQNSRQLSAEERQKKWAAYQALPPEERRGLAQQARRKQQPVVLPDSEPGPREAGQRNSLRRHAQDDRKTNVVPNTTHAAHAPQAITPTLIRSGPGATTSLVNQTASPPLHQHTGLSKINAAKDFVDPQTMLPRKGPQGAAMTPLTPPQATSATVGKP